MDYVAMVVVVVAIAGLAIHHWARFRAFRAEVVIECLRLWREQITDFYQRHPEAKSIMSIPEEAMYSAMHSEHRQAMYSKAWANVKSRRGKSAEQPLIVVQHPTNPAGQKRSKAIEEFAKEIESWPEEQARTALLLIKATASGDTEQIDKLYPELTVGQFRAVEQVVRKMEQGG
jgi:hypothetical protein